MSGTLRPLADLIVRVQQLDAEGLGRGSMAYSEWTELAQAAPVLARELHEAREFIERAASFAEPKQHYPGAHIELAWLARRARVLLNKWGATGA